MIDWCGECLYYYKRLLIQSWQNLGPVEYLVILTFVGVVGFIMMSKGPQPKC
jgi:hypothetical protein